MILKEAHLDTHHCLNSHKKFQSLSPSLVEKGKSIRIAKMKSVNKYTMICRRAPTKAEIPRVSARIMSSGESLDVKTRNKMNRTIQDRASSISCDGCVDKNLKQKAKHRPSKQTEVAKSLQTR